VAAGDGEGVKRARSGVIAALSLGVAILGMSASHAATAGGGTLRVEGAVKSPRTFDVAALQALGADTVSWEYRGCTRSVIGVPLIRVLEACGWEAGVMGKDVPAAKKRAGLRMAVTALAPDGFRAVFSLGEIAGGVGATRAYVAWAMDGAPLAPEFGALRLAVPTDAEPSRGVHDVRTLRVVDLQLSTQHGREEATDELTTVVWAALLCAFLTFVFSRLSDWFKARATRARTHRNALVRLERVCIDNLNGCITNRKLAVSAASATAAAKLYWKFPHALQILESTAVEVVEIELVRKSIAVSLRLRRYNNDIADLVRAHEALQQAHLGGTLVTAAYAGAVQRMSEHWELIAAIHDELEREIVDLLVHGQLLVREYDSPWSAFNRALGVFMTQAPSAPALARAIEKLNVEREKELLESADRMKKAKQAALESIAAEDAASKRS